MTQLNSRHRIKIVSVILVILLLSSAGIVQAANETVTVISGIPRTSANTANAAGKYNSNWQYWSQGASQYSVMRSAGCRVVAYAKLLAEIGCAPSDPDALFNWMGTKSYINKSSCLELGNFGVTPVKYAEAKGKTLKLVATPKISGSNANNAATVMNYINQGYYVIVLCGNHTAYIGRNASLANNLAVILDSWSSWTSSPYTAIKYSTYNHQTFTRILAFELNGSYDPVSVTTTDAKNVTETNAVVYGKVTKLSSITSGMTVGIYFGESANSMSKVKTESPSAGAYKKNSGTGFDMWYDLNTECGKTLKHCRTYYWQCFATYGGKEYKGALKSFTTPGSHSWGSGVVTKQPTCTSTGTRKYTCSCGETKTESISKTGHTEDKGTITEKATCISEGTKTYKCTQCGTVIRTETIAKTDHIENEGTITKKPTCTENGEKSFSCINCGRTKEEVIPALGHDWEIMFTVDKIATCKEEGSQSIHCSRCDEKKDQESIDKLDHTWDSGEVTQEATTSETGTKTYTCVVCGETRTETIPRIEESEPSTEPEETESEPESEPEFETETEEEDIIVAEKITVNKKSVVLLVGEAVKLTETITPDDVTDPSVTWKSSNKKIASVSDTGLVKAKKAGNAIITVKTSNGKKATCKITVKKANVTKVKNINIYNAIGNPSKTKKTAASVKKGQMTLYVNYGFLKFKAPKTKTYSFTFSKISPLADISAPLTGFAMFYNSSMFMIKDSKVSTKGGKSATLNLSSKTGKVSSGKVINRYLPSRTGKLKLKKGQVIYIYLNFCYAGKGAKVNLKIS